MKIPLRAALLPALLLAAGCSILHHKPKAAPEPPPAASVEADFHDRFIDKRVHDLMAADPKLSEADARKTAEADFAREYPYLRTVNRQNPH